MARRNITPEQIITHLRQVEVPVGQGKTIGDACRLNGVPEQTYYRWHRECGGMEIKRMRWLKALEQKNCRPKRALVDQALDIAIPKEAAKRSS